MYTTISKICIKVSDTRKSTSEMAYKVFSIVKLERRGGEGGVEIKRKLSFGKIGFF